MKTWEEKVRDGDVVRRADGTYVERGNSPSVSNGNPAPSNVSREYGSEVAGVFFRADVAAEAVFSSTNRRN